MLGFCPLASGSKGNALYLGTQKTRILIDAGISYSSVVKKLEQLEVSIDSIAAVLISHDHSDHVRGLATFVKKWNIPVFANADTAKGICSSLGIRPRFKIFTTGESFVFQDLCIHPFSVPHDTLDPVAFRIETPHGKIGICTDLGYVPSLVKKNLELCDVLYLEANHEPSMVHACSRPLFYKQRVLSKQGHLSNADCARLVEVLMHARLRHVYLAHLSEECNREQAALQAVQGVLHPEKIKLSIAYQDRLSDPFFWDLPSE